MSIYAIFNDQSFNDTLTNDVVKFEQLGPGVYPNIWKIGYIKPLYKGDGPTVAINYSGIIVMPCLAKLLNGIFSNRLQKNLDSNNITNPCQTGFQPNERTTDHIFILRISIKKFNSNKSKLCACFVDFEKALDSALHSALLHKLTQLGIKGPFYDIVRNKYLENLLHVAYMTV